VHGRVFDLCRPSERRFNTAVKIVLGRNTDSIVVDHEETAIQCIDVSNVRRRLLDPTLPDLNRAQQYLRQNRSGQATFIPLDTIQVKQVQDRLRSLRGARLAIDVIQYDPLVERAMQHACGSALVCDTMEIARDICYNKGIEVKGKQGFRSHANIELIDYDSCDSGRNDPSQKRSDYWRWSRAS